MLSAADDDLGRAVGAYYDDPLGFVYFIFPWGSGSLEHFDGPDIWAADLLSDIGAAVRERGFDGSAAVDPVQVAVSSGHGIGKSALTAWLILWLMSTRPYCKGVVTATTMPQLAGKTWPELAKWRALALNGHWFDMNTSKGNLRIAHKAAPDLWFTDGQSCREENSEAFAGLHAADSSPFYLFDEASGVPDRIWEVAEGGKTDGEPFHFVFGNPTKNTGAFRECFGSQKHRWLTRRVDSRTVNITNKDQINRWIDDYGEDSDFVRVRVRGEHPRASSTQFIGSDVVDACREYRAEDNHAEFPVVCGVDVARFGDDQSVILLRQGRKVFPLKKYRELDTMALADKVAEAHEKHRFQTAFIDGVGVGSGVVDRCRQLGVPVIDVNAGGAALEPAKHFNLRAEMWSKMRDYLKAGADIPDDSELLEELQQVEYGFSPKQQLQIEKKQDMKKRGLSSPDCADALALTFAREVKARRKQTRRMAPRLGRF